MNDDSENQAESKKKHIIPWLHSGKPADRTCGARTRSGGFCKKWKLKGRERCANHGGKSTGPRTPHTTHGESTLEALKQRILRRVQAAVVAESKIYRHGDIAAWIGSVVSVMTYPQFRQARRALSDFASGSLSISRLAAAIEKESKNV